MKDGVKNHLRKHPKKCLRKQKKHQKQ
jgi:hypothetical protein